MRRKRKWYEPSAVNVALGLLSCFVVFAVLALSTSIGPRMPRATAIGAIADAVHVANALREYRSKHGRWPEDSDQLISAQLGDAKWFIDPWNQPFTWQDSPDGLSIQLFDKLARPTGTLPAPPGEDVYVYSIGANGIDEKGAGDDIPNWDPDQNYLHHESYTNESPLALRLRRFFAK